MGCAAVLLAPPIPCLPLTRVTLPALAWPGRRSIMEPLRDVLMPIARAPAGTPADLAQRAKNALHAMNPILRG